MERKAKKVCESEAEQVQLVMANHLNVWRTACRMD